MRGGSESGARVQVGCCLVALLVSAVVLAVGGML